MRKIDVVIQIGTIIRELRSNKGFSQDELSFKCNLHRTYIGTIERGEKVPSIITLERIASALEVDLSEIFKLYEIQKKQKDVD